MYLIELLNKQLSFIKYKYQRLAQKFKYVKSQITPANTTTSNTRVCVQVRRASVTQAADGPQAEADPPVHPPAGPLRRGGGAAGGAWGLRPPWRPWTHQASAQWPAPLLFAGAPVQTARRAHRGLPGEAGPRGPRASVLVPGLQRLLLHRRQ